MSSINTLLRELKVRNKPAPWLKSEIKKEMFNRNSLKKKAIKSGSQNDWSTFKKARNPVNYSTRCDKSEYYRHKDLFHLYILFSQYRSCDDTQEI